MISNISAIIQEISNGSDGCYAWRIPKVLALMGTINNLLYISASESGVVRRVANEDGSPFQLLIHRNRPRMLAMAGFRASMTGTETYLAQHWPNAAHSRRAVRECNDLLQRHNAFVRHVFFDKNGGQDGTGQRFSLYTRFDAVGLTRLFEALERWLKQRLKETPVKIAGAVIGSLRDAYAHGAMLVRQLFSFLGGSSEEWGSGNPSKAKPGSKNAIAAQRQIATRAANDAAGHLEHLCATTNDAAPLIDSEFQDLNPEGDYAGFGVIAKARCRQRQYQENVMGANDGEPSLEQVPPLVTELDNCILEPFLDELPY